MKKLGWLATGIIVVGLVSLGIGTQLNSNASTEATKSSQSSTKQTTKTVKKQPVKTKIIDWKKPSENKAYPKMDLDTHNWLKVSIKKQRVFVMSPKNQVLYKMNASTGANDSTPQGTFYIQAERGKFFYNASSKEGARYWTSWKDHGVYLFHTVPTNDKGQYIKSEAEELGKTANSHGCIRLSIPDAKWINHNVPTGTKVVIE
ncbi:L,D-transpeptidase [Lactobacillaceae bacterium Scapto_B20]